MNVSSSSIPADITPSTFVLFELSYDDSTWLEKVPVAVMVKLDDAIKDKVAKAVADMKSGLYRALELNVPAENMCWLDVLAFTPENSVASIEGWFDPENDNVVYAAGSADITMDGLRVDYGPECKIFTSTPMEDPSLVLSLFRGQVHIGAHSATPDWNCNSLLEQWDVLRAQLHNAEAVITRETPRG